MPTNVPKPTFSDAGFVSPSESVILDGVMADLNVAFGGNLNPALNTPQGQLSSSEAAILAYVNDAFAFLASQMDPAHAQGRYQDALGRIYFINRIPSKPTLVDADCTGLNGTVIPEGALATAQDGNRYTSTAPATIGISGTVVVEFACTVDGPIPCPAGSLNQIYQAIPGWDTINNPADGVFGNAVENRFDFEIRRRASVAQNSIGSLPSVLGAVLNVAGVTDAYVTENTTGAPLTIGGFSVAAKSIYVAALGGLDADVAQAIWSKKAPGAAYNGNTTVVVLDQSAGYIPPYPSYSVTFERPLTLDILIEVKIISNTLIPSNAATLIQTAILNAFNGVDGSPRARIGSKILASTFYAAVVSLGPWAQVISIHIGSALVANASFTGSITGTLLSTSAVSGTPGSPLGQTIIGIGVLDGTKIISGAGPTYTLNKNHTTAVGSEAMASVLPTLDTIQLRIDQTPRLVSQNITVTLV